MNKEKGYVHRRSKDYAKVPSELMHDTKISDGAVRLYAHMHWRYGSNRKMFEGQESMAKTLGVSTKTISRRAKELAKGDWIVICYRSWRGQYTSNFYHVFELPSDCRVWKVNHRTPESDGHRTPESDGHSTLESDKPDSVEPESKELKDSLPATAVIETPDAITPEQLGKLSIPKIIMWLQPYLAVSHPGRLVEIVCKKEAQGRNRTTLPGELEKERVAQWFNRARIKWAWDIMVGEVADALGENLSDPGVGGQVGRVTKLLWSNDNPYSPDEIREYVQVKDVMDQPNWRQYVTYNTLPGNLSKFRTWKKDNPDEYTAVIEGRYTAPGRDSNRTNGHRPVVSHYDEGAKREEAQRNAELRKKHGPIEDLDLTGL